MTPHLIFLGVVFLVLAHLVGVQKKTWLLSGFNQHRVRDKEKLAKLAGSYNFIVGIAMIVAGLIDNPDAEVVLPISIVGFVILLGYVNTRMVDR
ncbi:DUF3784 domain-containing protein [Paenibacillus herberti]|uniref:Exonuclease n=1 Tax=Paenibacillus herberti TaxID=1619309 RepID=A0A229P2M2_9BACL|nr:DUF3784 domain-containing protein [Paenibacillus herberti]OXM16358.1 exonuclease [Paenibacillus herberti]